MAALQCFVRPLFRLVKDLQKTCGKPAINLLWLGMVGNASIKLLVLGDGSWNWIDHIGVHWNHAICLMNIRELHIVLKTLNNVEHIGADNSIYSVTRILYTTLNCMKYWETKQQTDRSFMYGQWVPLTGSLSAFLAARCYFSFLFLLNSKSSLKKTHQAHSNCTSWKQTHKLFPILAGYNVILVLIFGSYPNGLWPDQLRSQRPHSPPGASGSRSTAMAGNGGLHRLEIPKMVGL